MKYITHGAFMRLSWMKMSTLDEDVIFAKFFRNGNVKDDAYKISEKIFIFSKGNDT